MLHVCVCKDQVFRDIEVVLFPMQAITGLNGMQLGEKKLIVQRASVGAKTNMNNVSNKNSLSRFVRTCLK